MRPTVSGFRAWRGAMLAATILTAASACDKLTPAFAARSDRPPHVAVPPDTLDISGRPRMLYQVFGERSDPRMLPVAALTDGILRPLTFSDEGWRVFDRTYHQPGALYTLYRDGRATGTARVMRPMWDASGAPLYSLPHCARPTPLAAARVKAPPPLGYMVEFLATDAPLPTPARRIARGQQTGARDPLAAAQRIAAAVAQSTGLPMELLATLDFDAATVATGVGETPTLVLSLVDAEAGTDQSANGIHLFALADRVGTEIIPSYARVVRGDGPGQYRRYVDHLDLTGDGVDELVLEGWTEGQESYLLILQFQRGRWAEVFRGRTNWCLD